MNLILISSEEEAAVFLKNKNKWNQLIFQELIPWKGFQKDNWIVLICGIGLTNATAALTWLYCYQQQQSNMLKQVILLGCSGSLRQDIHKIGDFVLINAGYYLYADATYFGYDFGQIPKEPALFKADYEFNQGLMKIFDLHKPLNNIASCNSFIVSQDDILWPQKNSLPFSLIDMEATAVLQIATKFNLKVAVIKIISDFIPKHSEELRKNSHKYENNINDVSNKINQIINKLTD